MDVQKSTKVADLKSVHYKVKVINLEYELKELVQQIILIAHYLQVEPDMEELYENDEELGEDGSKFGKIKCKVWYDLILQIKIDQHCFESFRFLSFSSF